MNLVDPKTNTHVRFAPNIIQDTDLVTIGFFDFESAFNVVENASRGHAIGEFHGRFFLEKGAYYKAEAHADADLKEEGNPSWGTASASVFNILRDYPFQDDPIFEYREGASAGVGYGNYYYGEFGKASLIIESQTGYLAPGTYYFNLGITTGGTEDSVTANGWSSIQLSSSPFAKAIPDSGKSLWLASLAFAGMIGWRVARPKVTRHQGS